MWTPSAELALEPVRVEQRQEELEVLLLAGVRRGGHQQEVPRGAAQHLAELVALGLLDLAAEVVGRHLVRLVDDDQVPLGGAELRLQVLVTGQVVEPGDQQVAARRTGCRSGRPRSCPG